MRKLFLFLFLPIVLLLLPVSTVGIEFDGDVCYYHMSGNSTLEVHYTHSVSLTKVVDVYSVSRDGLYFIQERWQEFLAGQPIDFDYRDGPFYVKNVREYLGNSWEYWFIPVNNVTITIDGDVAFRQPGNEGVLEIRVGRAPLILSILRGC
ncbi:DUF1850 domain-containing protein [Thermococcus sp. MAR1]|uniref:DUF1850 domain-containing protein n=1 Tax=Thermococcus sp. MAR1 TaxID=1638263 RepID=UPI00143BF408|nr:DUF1850 domain-containing protein [Thermococcus sp. MAR1]NJE09863.1 DUF1850 domain-containing protein [Thermococcus sp. MAR1]